MRVVLDTSVLLLDEHEPPGDEHAISVVSLAELHFGVHRATDAATRAIRLRRLGMVESAFAALPVDDATAREYGRLAAICADRGASPRRRALDLLIAATANVNEAHLATRDADLEVLADVVRLV